MPRARRITNGRDIRSLLRRGRRSKTRHLDVFDSVSPAAFCRVGIIVPKHRRSAVERNRLKRRLREIVRREILPASDLDTETRVCDVLVRARASAYEASFEELRDELRAWREGRWSRKDSST